MTWNKFYFRQKLSYHNRSGNNKKENQNEKKKVFARIIQIQTKDLNLVKCSSPEFE